MLGVNELLMMCTVNVCIFRKDNLQIGVIETCHIKYNNSLLQGCSLIDTIIKLGMPECPIVASTCLILAFEKKIVHTFIFI